MNSLDNLPEEGFARVSEKYFSIYPLLYYRLRRFRTIDFKFKDANIHLFFDYLFNENKLYDINKTFINLTQTLLIKKYSHGEGCFLETIIKQHDFYEQLDFVNDLIDLSKTFFAYEHAAGQYFKTRIDGLKAYYNDKDQVVEQLNNFSWRHDGWWNNYFGPLIDNDAYEVMSSIYNNRCKRKHVKNNYVNYTKMLLTLSYRLAERDEMKKARAVARKGSMFLRYRTTKYYQQSRMPISHNKHKRIKSYLSSYGLYARYKLNFMMFLYRSTSNVKKKKRILKRLYKIESLQRLFFTESLSSLMLFGKYFSNALRPQHMLKLIEIRVDLCEFADAKFKKHLLAEINFLIIEFVKTLRYEYYSYTDTTIYYFMITEFYFVIFYYLEKIHNINIQDY